MKKSIFPTILLLTFLLAACGGKKEVPTEQKEENNPTEQTTNIEEKVVYKEAVVYAGSTDFVFENGKKETIMIRVSNEENTIKFPGNMLDTATVEGPPGANPALVGKSFLIIKNSKGEVIEIKLSE